MRTTLVVPSLNELDGLKIYMPQIKKEWADQIIVLDGKSSDGTVSWAKSQGYEVFEQTQKGMWHAYSELFKSGIVKGDIVITFSPDGNSLPSAIPLLTAMIEYGYDMVIASRYLWDAKSTDDTLFTGFGNRLLTGIVNLRSHFRYTDSLVMFRAYRTEIIEQLALTESPNWLQQKLIKMSGLYSYEPSLAIRAGRSRLKVAEIPASEPKAIRPRRQSIWVHGTMILTQIIHEEFVR